MTTSTLTNWQGMLTLTIIPVLAVGCVPQDKFDESVTAYRSAREQLQIVEDERDASQLQVQSLQAQLADRDGAFVDLRTQNTTISDELSDLQSSYERLITRISTLEIGPLPEDVEAALGQLAATYPDVIFFDARSGMLRFSSDFTFDSGSSILNSKAQASITALAAIFNATSASGLECRIIGHTDNIKPGNPSTLRNHPTNVHLSVHRAISVRSALIASGVSPIRLMVAGYGETRPIVENTNAGSAENRRVEIFLTTADYSPYALGTGNDSPGTTQATEPTGTSIDPVK